MKEIQLQHGNKTLIDDEDYDRVSAHHWRIHNKRNYVTSVFNIKGKKKAIFLHRFIMNPPEGMFIDHINRDPLDNRRSNLRVVTHQQNMRNKGVYKNNKSGCRGIYHRPSTGKYETQISHKGKNIHIGTFQDIDSAICAYNEAHKKMFDYEFWNLNKI